MNEKKIEPTAAMVRDVECWRSFTGTADRTPLRPILRAALNHYDAPGLFADVDDRPWEPLNEGDPLHVGDEVRRDHCGIITTGVVARVDEDGDPLTADGYLIGLRDYGTWYVRRAVQELPTEGGIVIVANDGRDDIEAIGPFSGATWRTKEAVLGADGRCYGVWRLDARTPAAASVAPEHITPGTWKVEGE